MSCTTSVRSPLILACGLVIPVLKWSDLAGSQPATAKYRTGFLQQMVVAVGHPILACIKMSLMSPNAFYNNGSA